MTHTSHSPDQTRKIGADFAKGLQESLKNKFVLVGLFGDLGAGKTTFVQGVARGCGIDPRHYVNSPTFTLINEYQGKDAMIVHVDLYRIEKPIEGLTLAIEEYFRPGSLIVVEWPSKCPDLVKDLDFEIRFEVVSDKERSIEVSERRTL